MNNNETSNVIIISTESEIEREREREIEGDYCTYVSLGGGGRGGGGGWEEESIIQFLGIGERKWYACSPISAF